MTIASPPEASHRPTPSTLRTGWMLLALVAFLLMAVGVFNALWFAMVDGQPLALLGLPVNLLVGYWFGMGAWRRAHPPTTDRPPTS